MKSLRMVIGMLLLVLASGYALAADSRTKRVDVEPVDVPEKIVIQPTPAEIHDDAPPGQPCSSCHGPNSVDAESKPLNHFLTTKECGTCHFNKSWVPLRKFTHMSGKYPCVARAKSDVSPDDCLGCHKGNTEFLAPGPTTCR